MKCSLGISDFLEEISSLSRSIFFPLFLCTDRWGRLSYFSLLFFGTLSKEFKGVQTLWKEFFGNLSKERYIFPFLLCLSLLFFSQLFVRSPQTDNHFAFLHFFFLGMVLITVSCTMYYVLWLCYVFWLWQLTKLDTAVKFSLLKMILLFKSVDFE